MIAECLELFTRWESHRFFHRLASPDLEKIKDDLAGRQDKDKQIALYIHIPFCRKLCPYCSFVRYEYRETPALIYMESLHKELDLYLDLIQDTGIRVASVYLGGGTPTLLPYSSLTRLIHYLQDRLGVKEISVETNPSDLKKVKDLFREGVTRLSIGVQSFSDEILHDLGRLNHHDSESAKDAVAMAQGRFKTVNVDMIWDLPRQDITHLEKDIRTLFELDVDQVTFYPLIPSPNRKTMLERQFNRMNQGLFQKNRRHKKTYEFIRDALKGRYVPSTVWCFSKRGVRTIDEYAIDYEEYIGLGCGSVSLINGHYHVNTFPLDKYNRILEKGNLPIVRGKKLSGWELSNYRLLTGLFGVCIDKRKLLASGALKHSELRSGNSLKWRMALFKRLGYLVEKRDCFFLTPKGMYQVDLLMRQTFSGMNSLRELCLERGI
ncbi:MAG: radical SAM protein [bacterium]